MLLQGFSFSMFYLWIDSKGFVGLSHTEEVIDNLLHSKVQPFLQK